MPISVHSGSGAVAKKQAGLGRGAPLPPSRRMVRALRLVPKRPVRPSSRGSELIDDLPQRISGPAGPGRGASLRARLVHALLMSQA